MSSWMKKRTSLQQSRSLSPNPHAGTAKEGLGRDAKRCPTFVPLLSLAS